MFEKLIESFGMLLIGMGGVFASLAFFYAMIILMNRGNSWLNKRSASKKLNISQVESSGSIQDEIKPEILAVIAAAVYATLQEKVKIKTIKFLTQPDDTSWSRIGRLSLIESHIVKK